MRIPDAKLSDQNDSVFELRPIFPNFLIKKFITPKVILSERIEMKRLDATKSVVHMKIFLYVNRIPKIGLFVCIFYLIPSTN